MIISRTIIINKPTGKYFKYYKELGYDVNKEKIEIDIKHLSLGSKYKIDAKCNYCQTIKKVDYNSYNKSTNKGKTSYCCKKCASIKHKEVFFEKNGVENPFQLEEIKKKIKKKNLENWGVENYTKTEEYLEKSKKTSLYNWDVDNPSKSVFIKTKKVNTLLKNWGVDNPLKSEEIKQKVKNTNLKKYGYESPLKSEKIKQKVKNTNLKKYGYEFHTMTDEWKLKIKFINLEKYGLHPSKSEFSRKENYKISNDKFYISYIGDNISLFKCDINKSHEFKISYDNYKSRLKYNIPLCTVCNPIGDLKSIKEKELFEFVNSIYNGDVIQSYRDGLEIDIYLPYLKLGFEFNGLYWHSELFKEKNYHIEKTKYFEERGIRIIHIWEDDWSFKRDILESQIKNWLGLTSNKIFARSCEIREITDSREATKFLEENHIQGCVRSNLKLGLYYNGYLVSLMTFDHLEGRNKMNMDEWNLNRFCNKRDYSVVGGASRLLKYFLKNNNTKRVISYSDNDWSLGRLYEKLGFQNINEGRPDYKYIFKSRRVHKSRFRKSITGLTESRLDFIKIWDCGKNKFELFL
jgi:hypothetical protein